MTEEEIKRTFLEYTRQNGLSSFNTTYYFAKQILPDESLFLKQYVIEELKETGIMRMIGEKWTVKEYSYKNFQNNFFFSPVASIAFD